MVDQGVKAAERAFVGWGEKSGKERGDYLRKIADEIEKNKTYLAKMETKDNGKPLHEAEADMGDTIDCFRYYAQAAEDLDSQQDKVIDCETKDFHVTVRKEGVGVAALIIPWNYPLLMAAWKVAPCLAAGAVCVLKPSEESLLTALELGGICQRVGVPRGVVNILPGRGETGAALCDHPGVHKVAFTGSRDTGVKVSKTGCNTMKTMTLELGGKSPVVVFDDGVDIDFLVEWIMVGIFYNAGQVCSATSRLIVQKSLKKRLLEALVERTKTIKVGRGEEEGVLMGPLIAKRQQDRVQSFIQKGKEIKGAKVVYEMPIDLPDECKNGYYVGPTIFDVDDVSKEENNVIWEEEIFGPVLCVKSFETEEEGIKIANDSVYGLAGAVFSADKECCLRVSRSLRVGCMWINCSQPNFVHAPWGGYKQSGVGRELGPWGIENYLEVKQVCECVDNFTWECFIKK